jgi:hypothetical protein
MRRLREGVLKGRHKREEQGLSFCFHLLKKSLRFLPLVVKGVPHNKGNPNRGLLPAEWAVPLLPAGGPTRRYVRGIMHAQTMPADDYQDSDG